MTVPAPTPPPAPAPDPTPPPASTPPPSDRSFTQDDVDRIVQERLARAKKELPPDYEELKAAKQKLDELEAANATELERAQKRAEDAEKEREKILTEVRETRLRSAIIAEAAKPERSIVDPEAVVQLIDRDTLDIDDNGVPTNVAKAMDALLEKRPYLVAARQGGNTRTSADQGARDRAPNQVTEAELAQMSPEQTVEARKAGRLVDLGIAP